MEMMADQGEAVVIPQMDIFDTVGMLEEMTEVMMDSSQRVWHERWRATHR